MRERPFDFPIFFMLRGTACAVALALLVSRCAPSPTEAELAGVWGGDHLSMDLGMSGATLEYDCATGAITEPVVPNADDRFEAKGYHAPGHGGPVREGEIGLQYPARYDGVVHGSKMTLVVSRTDTASIIGTFELERGRIGSVFRCL